MNIKKNMYFYYDGKTIPYELTYKPNMRRTILKIDSRNKIKISCPLFVTERDINNFIYDNIDKIMQIKNKKEESEKFNISKNNFYYLGEKLNIDIVRTNGNNTFSFRNNSLLISLNDRNKMFDVMKKFYNKQAKEIIPKRLNELSLKTGLNFNQVSIKWMESKWGHCDSFNNIVISSKLLIHNWETINYVLIHELCHTIHHNHSNDFWNLVSKFIPNYKEIKKEMKGV